MPFTQPDLPYSLNALEGFCSEEQMSYHYGKHHAAYFEKLNLLTEGRLEREHQSIEEIILSSEGEIFNNSAQAWNHSFFWLCLSPDGGGAPGGSFAEAVQRDFGDFSQCMEQFSKGALSLFGSGWEWLVCDREGRLELMSLGNADTPIRYGKVPLLTIDVWEHAYYVDYRNQRGLFIKNFWGKVCWKAVENRYLQR